ncbi:cytochrome P450 [Streptomyces sp. NPDC005438]|uniref:cytochrome P450 n=1 Tax=Streptomyces sp. NPDC005438 TaxID=3156880 RepID=UPI00339EC6F2
MTQPTAGNPLQPPPGCPAHQGAHQGAHPRQAPEGGSGLPMLYGPDFAADPEPTYRRLRETGPVAWVEIAPGVTAMVATSYGSVLKIVHSPNFTKDSRRWRALNEGKVPMDTPVLPMMMYRPSLLFADDTAQNQPHTRLRAAIDDSWGRVDPQSLRDYIEQAADRLIDVFARRGEADLVGEYAEQLPLLVFTRLFGAPTPMVDRMATACARMIDAEGPVAQQASADLAQCLGELVHLKRANPGADVTTWMLEHPSALTDEEMVHQMVVLIGAGTVPTSTWTANALRLLLTDDRFAGNLSGGGTPVTDALDEVLWNQSPMANYSMHYGEFDEELDGVLIPAGVPVLISHAMANTDPALVAEQRRLSGNRAHLAFSAGPHTCPAQDEARVIATAGIEKILDRLPEMEITVPVEELTWRPGPFHRALNSLPVRFPPESVLLHSDETRGDSRWNPDSAPYGSTPQDVTSTVRPPDSASRGRRRWWSSLVAWWHGQ